MKAFKYILLLAPILLLIYCKYRYDIGHDMKWALAWKLVLMCTVVDYLYLATISDGDKPFRIWCESIICFIVVNNVWDVFSEYFNIPFRMPSDADNPGRWLLFLGLIMVAISRTWHYKRSVKVYGE